MPTKTDSAERYDAFISYSRASGATLAEALQHGLQRFAKPWHQRRALRVFRDATTLIPDSPLPTALETAIAQSGHFILLLSPASAASPWVEREIEHWIARNGVERMLLVLVAGTLVWSEDDADFCPESSTALPDALYGAFALEPLYLNLTALSGSPTQLKQDPRLTDAVATLSAVVRKRSKDDLIGEDLAQHRRSLRLARGAAGLLAALVVATTVSAVVAVKQRDLAKAREQQARADQLAADASRLLVEQPDALELATLLAIEALKRDPAGNGQRALSAATTLLPAVIDASYGEGATELAFSPNGRWLARGDHQFGAMLWNLETGQLGQLSTPAEVNAQLEVRDLAFSADSRLLAIASGGHSARVYDLPDGDHERVFAHGDIVETVAFDPGGTRLATGGRDGRFKVWNLETQSVLHDEAMTDERVSVVAFSPDGAVVAAVADNGPIRVYDASSWQRVDLERTEPGVGLAMAFSPDGSMLAITRGDRAVVWSLADGRIVGRVEHSEFARDLRVAGARDLWALTFSPDSELLVTAGGDATTRFWRPRTGEEVLRFTHRSPADSVAFSASGEYVATGAYNIVQLWQLPEGTEVLRAAPTGSSNAMALSRDGAMIASAGPQSSIRVLRTATAAGLQQFSQDADIAALACHPDEPLVAAADDKHNVRVWNVDTRRETAQTTLFGTRNLRFLSNGALAVNATEAVFTLAPDGAAVQRSPRYPAETVLHDRHVAVRTRDGTILVGPPDDGTPLQLDEPNAVALAFNENGRLLATVGTADTGGLLRVWDAATGDALWEAPLPSAYGARPAVDAAGSHAAYVHGRTLVYLDRTSGSSQTRAFDSSPRGLSFVLGSSRLAVLQSDALALFDANDLQAEPLRLQLDVEVIAVAFNRARDKAAITTGREITVWDLATGTRLAALGTAAFTPRLCFLAGDDALALGDHANRITVRPWRTSALVNAACNHLSRNLTRREWELYLPGVPYAATCPDLTPLTREALVADMFAEDAADAPSPPP